MKVSLVYSPTPRQVQEWSLTLASGSTVAQALEESHFFEDFPALMPLDVAVGVWSKPAELHQVLHENDRVEIYLALRVDPKIARRERFSRQGVKRAGLFSGARAGAKAGY